LRESIKQFVEIVSESLPLNEPIFEFGSLQVSEPKEFSDIRPFFNKKKFVGCDIRNGPGVDLILDLHDIKLPSESVGTVIILDTLEHVEYPRKALKEIHRILKPNGILIITSVMNFKIHEFPHDFWRFTPQGFESLLNHFQNKFVGFAGDEEFPHTVVGLASKKSFNKEFLTEFEKKYLLWKKQWYYYGNSTIKNAFYRPNRIIPFIIRKLNFK
jgi:SAM-dependent methyltransferase